MCKAGGECLYMCVCVCTSMCVCVLQQRWPLMSNYSRVTLWSVERANVLWLRTRTHTCTCAYEYSLIGQSVCVHVSVCVSVCITMTTTPSLPPSWLETISHSAPVVGQSQALQTFRPSIREASITTAWLASDWIQLSKLWAAQSQKPKSK